MCGTLEIMWSVICSVAPNLQFENEARRHLCINDQKDPTPDGCVNMTHDAQTHTHKSVYDHRYESMDC